MVDYQNLSKLQTHSDQPMKSAGPIISGKDQFAQWLPLGLETANPVKPTMLMWTAQAIPPVTKTSKQREWERYPQGIIWFENNLRWITSGVRPLWGMKTFTLCPPLIIIKRKTEIYFFTI